MENVLTHQVFLKDAFQGDTFLVACPPRAPKAAGDFQAALPADAYSSAALM